MAICILLLIYFIKIIIFSKQSNQKTLCLAVEQDIFIYSGMRLKQIGFIDGKYMRVCDKYINPCVTLSLFY